jgi:hypothetical protein
MLFFGAAVRFGNCSGVVNISYELSELLMFRKMIDKSGHILTLSVLNKVYLIHPYILFSIIL